MFIYLCWTKLTLNGKRRHIKMQVWSNTPAGTPQLASGNYGYMTFQGSPCIFKAHSRFLFHTFVLSVFSLSY